MGISAPFHLGIADLTPRADEFYSGGLYWIGVDREEDALALVLSIGEVNTFAGRPTLCIDSHISPASAGAFAAERLERAPFRVIEFLPDLEEPITALADVVRRAEAGASVVLMFSEEVFIRNGIKQIARGLAALDEAVRLSGSAVLVLQCGQHARRLRPVFFEHQMLLRGYANLRDCLGELEYEVIWWRSYVGNLSETTFRLTAENGRLAVHRTVRLKQTTGDRQKLFSSAARLASDLPLWAFGEQLPDNEAVFETGMRSHEATLIFEVSTVDDVKTVARYIHTLRLERGSGLRIVVMENMPAVRAGAEAVMFACGANLVLPAAVSPGYVRAAVQSMRLMRSELTVLKDFDAIWRSQQSVTTTGFCSLESFVKTVRETLSPGGIFSDGHGVLALLAPKGNINVNDAAVVLHLQRAGDLATVTDGKLALFLSGCMPSQFTETLGRIFEIDYRVMLTIESLFYRDLDILLALEELGRGVTSKTEHRTVEVAARYDMPRGTAHRPLSPNAVKPVLLSKRSGS